MTTITLAHSADADDVYMWWPLTGKLSPEPPYEVIAPPVIDSGGASGFKFVALPGDIAEFNRAAIAGNGPEVVAISFAALARCNGRYRATSFGSSFGDGYGPSLVTRPELASRGIRPLAGKRVALPGLATSAAITLQLVAPFAKFELVEAPFDTISALVREGAVDAGVIIHEEKLTFARSGLVEVLDLGLAWKVMTGLPLPLGANAVRMDLDTTHGPGTVARIVALLYQSITHARRHHAESAAYAWTWAKKKLADPALADQYLDLYVSDLTHDMGQRGLAAVHAFHARAGSIGALPSIEPVSVLWPGA